MWILMWIKENYNLNTFTDLEFSDFKIFNHKIRSKRLGKVQFLQSPARFALMTYIFVLTLLIHCATLLGDNFGGKLFIKKITLYFIVHFDK